VRVALAPAARLACVQIRDGAAGNTRSGNACLVSSRNTKLVINQAIEASGLMSTQRLATLFDGISRHSPEGVAFKKRVDQVGWKQAVSERDTGTYDWTKGAPLGEGD